VRLKSGIAISTTLSLIAEERNTGFCDVAHGRHGELLPTCNMREKRDWVDTIKLLAIQNQHYVGTSVDFGRIEKRFFRKVV
jgi:hypothetical protein